MDWMHLFLIISLWRTNSAYTKLFNTEDALSVQSYDCIYYTNLTLGNNQTTPHCIRTNESVALNRSFSTNDCENGGKEWTFKKLKEMTVSQDEVLTWNSSIEMADRYAAYLTTGDERLADEKICNCSLNTFGKFCEYQFLTKNSFEDTIQYQFQLKEEYRNGSQLWGNITCYTTLTDCYFGLRCLTWQNICDRKQQCMYGIDEDRCDELEYNECEENEYRCQDGSCIAEEYWLDGQYDCSDQSDEQKLDEYRESSYFCPLTSFRFECDEATAPFDYFACGDGQFVSDGLRGSGLCYNYRSYNFFCELVGYDNATSAFWTLENGHCVRQPSISKNITDLDDSEKCIFYLKCILTNSQNTICIDIISNFRLLCQNQTIRYPLAPFYKPYIQTLYKLNDAIGLRSSPNDVLFNGSIKCLGHVSHSRANDSLQTFVTVPYTDNLDATFCHKFGNLNYSDPQLCHHCWHDTEQAFFCNKSVLCMSKYRLRNGIWDCGYADEEKGQDCYGTQRHRLECFEESTLCITVSDIGDGVIDCDQANDEYISQVKWNLENRKCKEPNSIECNTLKSYIRSSSSLSTRDNNQILLFRLYCDSLWHLPKGFDESLCNNWKCPSDHYQCLSGHCVPKHSVLKLDMEWDCPDASDSVGMISISNLSEHNARFISPDDFNKMKETLTTQYTLQHLPFDIFCDATKEYGCLLASNATDPLDLITNRPCINLTQIGDGVIDCYGGLDERNLLTCSRNWYEQRGYDFHCSDHECIPYHRQCIKSCSNRADDLLCDLLTILWDSDDLTKPWSLHCRYPHVESSDIFRIGRYYCDTHQRRTGSNRAVAYPYRLDAWLKQDTWTHLSQYPNSKDTFTSDHPQPLQYKINHSYSYAFKKQEDDEREGWICGRGVAIKTNTINQIKCFCPPSLYGEYCQYYSDRITVIISFNNTPSYLLDQLSNTIKILALLLSNDEIIDHHVFHFPMIFSKEFNKKFRFHLIHRRPKISSDSYTVRFGAYHLTGDSSIKFLTVWEYPVKFPFLPSHRLVKVLTFAQDPASMSVGHVCRRANPCSHNSICHPIMNQINNLSAYYCHCKSDSYGKHCDHLLSSVTPSKCSKYALHRALSSTKSICLCPSHLYGPTCHLNHTCVNHNPCGVNHGKCYPNPDNLTRDYICVCDKKFFGERCQLGSALVKINFIDSSFIQNPSNFILSSIIQLYDIHNETLDLILQQKRVYQGLPPSITDIYHNNYYLPTLGIIKLYHKNELSNDYVANLKRPDYFILYIILNDVPRMNITSVINRTNYCPYTPIAFQKNTSHVSFLSEFITSSEVNSDDHFNATVMIFQYHLLCNAPYSLMCFHDDHYFCICDIYHHAECSRYYSTSDQCERCRARGQCIHGDLDDQRDFVCLCPRCYHGSICQHNTELFSFTLETLLTNDLYSSSIIVQQLFFSLLIIIPIILFLIGAVNNVCSYVTFNRPKPLSLGIGHYLRTTSIINQFTLFMLLLKLVHLVLSIKGHIVHHLANTILCKVLSYLLACTSRMSYWLMGMVAIERVYVTWYIQGTWLKSPRIAKRIIAANIIGIMIANVHELVYYQSIEDPKSLDTNNSTWCVTSYPSSIATYNQVNIILNYISPFLINLLSTIILIVLITRKRAIATTKSSVHLKSESHIRRTICTYVHLLGERKDLILAPLITMLPQLFALPQFILSFSLACQEFKVNWQRYLLISSYFITYLPQVLFYKLYVSPSSFYMDEFHTTKLYKTVSRWCSLINRRQV